jgi:hypothetical protein
MTALSAAYEAERQDGILVEVPVKASTTIYKGALLVDKGTGYAEPGTDGSYAFLGVAAEGANNSAGSDGAVKVRVYKTGTFKYAKAGGASQTDLTTAAYITDDATVAGSTTNSLQAGTVVSVVDSTYVKVRIDNFTK